MSRADEMTVSGLLAVLVLLTAAACEQPSTLSDPRKAQAQAKLPQVMRPGTRAAMSRHADRASALTVAVALGDYAQIDALAGELLAEPRPAAPSASGPSDLNQELPPRLFTLEDRFRRTLTSLQGAARARDDERTLMHLGAVVRACRTCHRAIREPTRR